MTPGKLFLLQILCFIGQIISAIYAVRFIGHPYTIILWLGLGIPVVLIGIKLHNMNTEE